METNLEQIIILLGVSVLVALAARWVRLPYTVGLVLVGTGLSQFTLQDSFELTHEFIFDVILPPLLFEAAINIHWRELKRDLLPVTVLAFLGVILAAVFVGWGIHYFLNWPWTFALLFGVIISATDPVAVIAMFKDIGVGGRLRLLVESESLLNDGVAAVLFSFALIYAQTGASPDTIDLVQGLLVTAGGGIAIGIICGVVARIIARQGADRLLSGVLSIVVAYGAFRLAEMVHVSGVLATVSAGIAMGNVVMRGQSITNKNTADDGFLLDLWEFVAFLANSLVFLLIGLTLSTIPFGTLGLGAVVTIIALTLVGRALAVYPLCRFFKSTRWSISLPQQHILWWGGLRGALGLALALALPNSLPYHNTIVVATFCTVAFSIIVQGVSMPKFLKALRLV